jgi:hypothetical protein
MAGNSEGTTTIKENPETIQHERQDCRATTLANARDITVFPDDCSDSSGATFRMQDTVLLQRDEYDL